MLLNLYLSSAHLLITEELTPRSSKSKNVYLNWDLACLTLSPQPEQQKPRH